MSVIEVGLLRNGVGKNKNFYLLHRESTRENNFVAHLCTSDPTEYLSRIVGSITSMSKILKRNSGTSEGTKEPCNRARSTPDLFVELVILSSSSLLKRDRSRAGLIPPPREYRASRVIIGLTMHAYRQRLSLVMVL